MSSEIEQKIADAINEIIPSTLADCIAHIDDYIGDGHRSDTYQLGYQLGKYEIPQSLSLRWKKRGEKAEKELDELFLKREEEIYETLAHCLQIIESCSEYEETPREFAFKIKIIERDCATDNLRLFAINQFLAPWQNQEVITPTYLTDYFHLRVTKSNEKLHIEHDGLKRTYFRHCNLYNTASHLPFIAYILNKFRKTAEEIIQAKNT